MDEFSELKAEFDHEIRARDHSLRYVGAVVLRLWEDLEKQDAKIGSGRANRDTPLGQLLHDACASIDNYKHRTEEIEKLQSKMRQIRK